MKRDSGVMNLDEATTLVGQVRHWHHRFEIAPGVVTPGSYDPGFLLDKLRLPERLDGMRVLDVGTSDGFFALETWRRGAAVTAIDYRGKAEHGYWVTEAVSGMDVAYEKRNVYDLSPETSGTFDIVLFLGVLYHLPDMMRALHRMYSLTKGQMFLETHCDDSVPPDIAAARYFRGSSLAGDPTNFWSPNWRCALDMLLDVGFHVDRDEAWGDRLFVACSNTGPVPGAFPKMERAYGLPEARD